ncbi:SHOCT domain-containing protein [bacterium]|nr:MAG: SHOCT domain-containing protein [bacterium]
MAVATPTTQNNSPSANAAPQVDVNTYRNEDDYERDARSRIPLGWRPLSTTTARGKVNMGRTLLKAGVFLPWAVMRPSRKGDPVTVTWVREGGSTAQPLPSSAPPSGPGTATDLLTQLERLGKLRDAGVLTEEEFQSQKENLLASDQ